MESKPHEYKTGPHPREKANIFSILTFSWTIPTFVKGWKQAITAETLHAPLKSHRSDLLGAKLAKSWEEEVKRCKNKGSTPSLLKAFLKAFGLELLMYGLLMTFSEALRILQPLILGGLIEHLTSNADDVQTSSLIAGGLILSAFASIFFTHAYFLGVLQLGMKLRVATCSLLYSKVLQLKNLNVGNLTTGQIVNLMSNDAMRFDYAASFIHDLWIGPVETCIVTYFVFGITGVAAFVGLVTIFVFIPFQVSLGKLISKLRMKTAKRSDFRIGLLDELVKGIQIVKMHAWEKPVSDLVSKARKKEIGVIRMMSNIRGILASFGMFHSRAASSFTIITFVLLGGYLSAKNVFVITSLFSVLSTTACLAFPMGISYVSEFLTSVQRVKDFLLLESSRMDKLPDAKFSTPRAEMKNVFAKWSPDSSDSTISNVSFNASGLTVLLGPVGAGKTSVLHTFLGELNLTSGDVTLNGQVSLSSQEPWVFSETIRQNILFGEDFKKERYTQVLRVCALNNDLEGFPEGDMTQVGERGMVLSGGQKARINLARAVYKEADVYLLDSPIAAVDTIVANHIFNECIREFLKGKIVILVCHQIKYLEDHDQVVFLEGGSVKFSGNFSDLFESNLLSPEILNDVEEVEETPNISDKKEDADENVAEDVLKTDGDKKKISTWSSYYHYIKAAGFVCTFVCLFLFAAAQLSASAVDYWLSYWVYLEEEGYASKTALILPSRDECIYIFSGLITATILVSVIRSFVFFLFSLRASQQLHNSMFSAITAAKMAFFYTNSSGNILSRFSKDVGVLDEHLPTVTMDFLQIGLMAVGIIVLVPTTNAWLLIPTFIALICFTLMRLMFVSTSTCLRKLEAVTSTPVYTHLSNSLLGLSTIHASKNEALLQKEFDSHQDYHSSSWYMFIAAARGFALWLDLVSVVYSAVIIISFLVSKQDGASVGLAITQCFGLFNILQWGVRQSAEMENHMISVDRIVEFTKAEPESEPQSNKRVRTVEGWPNRGEVSFKNVTLKYSPEGPLILKNLNFNIPAGDKVGIVGRTGSGKSSIINALFKMADIEGMVEIDGVDLATIGLRDFRPKITVIPQEPFLFSGTLRRNLDPFDKHEDPELWLCLEEVDLKQFVKNNGGLSMKISEGAQNLSVGQKQLVFLARAVLSANKIIVLDEATANIDLQTESLIQTTIKEKFQSATVITVAHRLNTIIESDIVIVMDNGNLVEIGHPYVLMNDQIGIFYNLIAEMGGLSDDMYDNIKEKYRAKTHGENL